MKRPRFTIANLLVVIFFSAIAIGSLRAASNPWDSGIFGITLLALLMAVLLVVHRSESKRAFWLGFCLFGGVYLVMSLIPSIESRLPTTKGLTYLDSKLPGRDQTVALVWAVNNISTSPQSVAFSPSGTSIATNQPGAIRLWNSSTGRLLTGPNATSENFVRIGHSLMVWIMGFLGGLLSRSLFKGSTPIVTKPEE